jgi:hypothetical protein
MKLISGMAAVAFASASLMAIAAPASAANYIVTYTPVFIGGPTGIFDVTTSDTQIPGSPPEYDITAFNGSFGTETGLHLTSADAVFFDQMPGFETSGVSLGNSAGASYEIQDLTGPELSIIFDTSVPGQTTPYDEFVSSVQVSAVPEPTVWAMMLGGMALMGFALRLGRRRTAGALAA